MDSSTPTVCHLLLLVVLMGNIPAYGGMLLWSSTNNVLLSGSKGHLRYVDSVSAGIQSAVRECGHQFYWDKWNCPEAAIFSSTQATREMSFVQAIASAGVMYTLTKNCSEGVFENCGCDNKKNGDTGGEGWTWGGCSDNLRFGERTSSDIMDSSERSQGAITVMNLHNNEAGRKAVKKSLERTCKCHGVSGSCTLQTCWNELASFRSIGDKIKLKYLKAVRVDFISGRLIDGNRAEDRFSRDVIDASLSRRDLVFLEQSPDYCRANVTLGVVGTAGRECMVKTGTVDERGLSATTDSRWVRESCSRLCRSCGMEVRKVQVVVTSSCNCNFVWCCSVKCDTCRRTVTRRTCQPIGRSR